MTYKTIEWIVIGIVIFVIVIIALFPVRTGFNW